MALNPAAYTETVVSNFLRCQMTAYLFADADLYAQMHWLLIVDEMRPGDERSHKKNLLGDHS